MSDGTELKREVGRFGSFSMGYADIGADIYISLGLIALYAYTAAPLALMIAAIAYITTGLSYAELASKYPVAGGAQYYAYKAFGKLNGFIAGWGLMLDYTVDIALFSLASVGYLGFLVKTFTGTGILMINPFYGLCAVLLIILLIGLNIIGIKYSSKFNEVFVLIDLLTVSIVLVLGLYEVLVSGKIFSWIESLKNFGKIPTWEDFTYAITLSMASYIGIESISQAAEETRNPRRIIPSATKATIVSVVIIAFLASLLSVTLIDPFNAEARVQDPMVALASAVPFIGGWLALWVGFMGFMICYVSTNTGVIGVSRVTFSMSRLNLSPKIFRRIHKVYRTPYVTIIVFSLVAILIILVNIFLPSVDLLELVASLYNFGALISYMYVNLALIVLRKENVAGWKVPGSISLRWKGENFEVPILPLIGFTSCLIIWIMIVATHEHGRLLGFAWFTIGVIIYLAITRRKRVDAGG
ncbi:MAG: APC family permease [Nitrososphaeria archaeon]